MTFTIAGISASDNKTKPERISALLWGIPGSGKTTLAATAPGRKLMLMFDPDGAASVGASDDIVTVDMTQMTTGYVDEVTRDNPFGLSKILTGSDNEPGFDTLIIDSLTNFGVKAVAKGIIGIAKASMVNPSMQGWGARTGYTHQLVLNMLALTSKLNKHLIFTAHEATPDKNSEGAAIEYPIGLGGQLPTLIPNLTSEVWYIHDAGKERRIMIRPGRMRRPMKTRMFKTTGDIEFPWRYNADTGVGEGLSDWFAAWVAGGKQKLDLPK